MIARAFRRVPPTLLANVISPPVPELSVKFCSRANWPFRLPPNVILAPLGAAPPAVVSMIAEVAVTASMPWICVPPVVVPVVVKLTAPPAVVTLLLAVSPMKPPLEVVLLAVMLAPGVALPSILPPKLMPLVPLVLICVIVAAPVNRIAPVLLGLKLTPPPLEPVPVPFTVSDVLPRLMLLPAPLALKLAPTPKLSVPATEMRPVCVLK